MSEDLGLATDGEGRPDGDSRRGPRQRGRLGRRRALAAIGSVGLASTAGCLDSIRHFGSSRVPVDPEDPGDDPEATPGEFHYMLEDNGISVDDLYHDTEENDLILFYESDAETRDESDEEIGLIYVVFRDGMVDRGTDVNHLYTEVVGGFDEQVEGWGVNAEWARNELDGEHSRIDVWNAIVDTMVYPDGQDRYGRDQGTETNGSSENGSGVTLETEPETTNGTTADE